MTNTGTGIQGIVTARKRHDHAAFRDWLKYHFGDLPFVRRDFILNRTESSCKYWYVQGGGDPDEFERLFNEK